MAAKINQVLGRIFHAVDRVFDVAKTSRPLSFAGFLLLWN